MGVPFVVIAAAASVGLQLLAGALEKSPKQDFNESLPDSSYRRNIPKTYNYYRTNVNWIEPFGLDEAFDTRTKGKRGFLGLTRGNKRDNLYGNFFGAVCNSQTDLVSIWVNGEIKASELHLDGKALEKGRDFLEKRVQWLDGSYEQLGREEYGNLKFANRAYYEELKAETGKEYNHNARVGYRGISCIGFKHLNLTEDIKTNTIPTVSVLTKTQTDYTLDQIVLDICKDAGIPADRVDVSELAGEYCGGFARPQNGEGFDQALGQLGLAYRFFATELKTGVISFRKYARPAGQEVFIKWQDLIPLEDGRLWSDEEADATDLPKTISLSFIDPDFDFLQNSVVSDEHPEAENQNQDSIDLPIVLNQTEAEEIANWQINQVWVRRKTYHFKLSLNHIHLINIGDVFVLPGNIYTQVQNYTIGSDYIIDVNAVKYDPKANAAVSTVSNSSSSATFVSNLSNSSSYSGISTEQTTVSTFNEDGTPNYAELRLLDIPAAAESHSELGIYCFSDRSGSILHLDREDGYTEELTFADVSTFGTCDTVLGSASNSNLQSAELPLIDDENTVDVTLISGRLNNEISDLAFEQQQRVGFIGRYDGSKWVGEYIGIQYADVLESGKYRLQGLQRGLRGTEWYIDQHQAGEEFFLLVGEEAYWERIIVSQSELNQSFSGKLEVVEDQNLDITPNYTTRINGQSIYPYPPVDVQITQDPEENLVFNFNHRYRGESRTTGEDRDLYELDLLNNGVVIRTLSGGMPLIYSQAQKIIDDLDLNALDANIYKISDLTGRGNPGLIRGLAVSGTNNIIVGNPDTESKGFKYISSNYEIKPEDDCYWLLIETGGKDDTDINITLPEITSVRVWVQNVGKNRVKLVGNLKATDNQLRPHEAIKLRNRTSVWHGFISGRVDIPQHLIANVSFTLSELHHNKIVSVESANTVTVTLDETALDNPHDFHTTIRKKGEGNIYFALHPSNSSSQIEAVGTTLATKYRAVYVGYEGNGVWILLGAVQ